MKKWDLYTSKEIKPKGWLKRQLEIQAEGLGGNLDKIWRDVRDSSWIGGNYDGWERAPYWLDGFIPLAYLLENEDMIKRAKRYIDAIISRQKPDGWICPCEESDRKEYDTWAVFLITKVLVVYYESSGDERVPSVIYRTLKNYYDLLSSGEIELFRWGKWRWFECFIALNFLKERYSDDWITKLAVLLKKQGLDYNSVSHLWKIPVFNNTMGETHIVNIAMQLKSEAVSHELLGSEYLGEADKLYDILRRYNGTPVATFTGDEHLAGLSPIHGTELCSIVELMYSYELLYAYTGQDIWAERLEITAFNALPAAFSDDMWAHQYVQLSNQIECRRFLCNPIFGTVNREAHLFGLEPNYGCCTANFNQGWPKFVLSAFMHKNGVVINVLPIPSELNAENGHIKIETDYPFDNKFKYTISARNDFIFKIRIPSFSKKTIVNGFAFEGKELSFDIRKGEEICLNIEFLITPFFEKRPYDLNIVKWGSLVFSVPIKYGKRMYEYEDCGVERKYPYCDYEYFPLSDWNYSYAKDSLKVDKRGIGDFPFSSDKPPVVVKSKVRKIDWGFEEGYDSVCAKIPKSRLPIGGMEDIELYPYGCSKLRMTEIPFIED